MIGAAFIQFYLCFTLAMLAFWILDIGSVTFILYSIEFLLGGHIFPVDAFPAWLQALCLHLPFAYHTFFPAAILIGHVHGADLAYGLCLAVGVGGLFLRTERRFLEAGAEAVHGGGRVNNLLVS